METYLAQLLSDLHATTLVRWRRCPPHFYQAGLRDAMHQFSTPLNGDMLFVQNSYSICNK